MTVIDNAELGRRLREYRQRRNITIEQAAAHLGGVDPSVVSKMETGKRNIDAIELAQLTVLYGVTFDVLFDTGRETCPMCAGTGWVRVNGGDA